MKVFRFMSQEEFDKYLDGEKLVNTADHRSKFSGSIGFCFFEYLDWTDNSSGHGISPEYAYEFLSGVAAMDVVAVFETDQELTKSYGRYADPYGSFFDTIWMDEYCKEEYSRDTFRLIKYGHIEYDDEKFESKAIWKQNKEATA